MGTLHEDLCTFMMISRWSLLRVRNIPDKICRENKITILCSITFFFTENLAVCEVMRENTVVLDRPQMAVRRVRFGCCIIKATNTHSEYVILLFPGNNRFTIASWCYIVRISPVLFRIIYLSYFCSFLFFPCFPYFFYSFTVSLFFPVIVVGEHMEETSWVTMRFSWFI